MLVVLVVLVVVAVVLVVVLVALLLGRLVLPRARFGVFINVNPFTKGFGELVRGTSRWTVGVLLL